MYSITAKMFTHPIYGEEECKFRNKFSDFIKKHEVIQRLVGLLFFQNDLKFKKLLGSLRVRVFHVANNEIIFDHSSMPNLVSPTSDPHNLLLSHILP
jgi:hypothetical protein